MSGIKDASAKQCIAVRWLVSEATDDGCIKINSSNSSVKIKK